MAKMYIKNVSSLEKVLPKTICELPEVNRATALLGEEFSYQIAFRAAKRHAGIDAVSKGVAK